MFHIVLQISGAMQKIFLIEDVDIRSNHEGRTYGVTYVLAKTTSFKQLHEVLIPARYIAKFSSSSKKFLMIRGYSQNEQGQIRILESSMVWISQLRFFSNFEIPVSKIQANCIKCDISSLPKFPLYHCNFI